VVMELFKSKGRIVMNYEFVYEEDFLITPVQSCDWRLGRYQRSSPVMEIFLKIPNRIYLRHFSIRKTITRGTERFNQPLSTSDIRDHAIKENNAGNSWNRAPHLMYPAPSRKLNPKELFKLLDKYTAKEVTKDGSMKM
jgi:hypothetical protein